MQTPMIAFTNSHPSPLGCSAISQRHVQWHAGTSPDPRTNATAHAAPAAKDCHIETLEHTAAATHNDHRKPQCTGEMENHHS